MVSYYGKLSAEVYDADKHIGRSFGDVEYYYERLKGITGKVLEPAVGNGRILIPLLEKGIDVEGFDYSDDMLELCMKNCETRGVHPFVSKQDMSGFLLEQQYQAVIVPCGSFLLLHNREQSVSALQCFYDHLEKGGKLIFDTFLQDRFTPGYVSKRVMYNDKGDTITLESTLVEVDYIQQVKVTHHKYEKWRAGKLVDSELEIFPLRWYGVEEMVLLLEKVGFQDITISADYRFGEYPSDVSQVITYEAVK